MTVLFEVSYIRFRNGKTGILYRAGICGAFTEITELILWKRHTYYIIKQIIEKVNRKMNIRTQI